LIDLPDKDTSIFPHATQSENYCFLWKIPLIFSFENILTGRITEKPQLRIAAEEKNPFTDQPYTLTLVPGIWQLV
jgi:hypothetical protein